MGPSSTVGPPSEVLPVVVPVVVALVVAAAAVLVLVEVVKEVLARGSGVASACVMKMTLCSLQHYKRA
jgi:hypothetical protein